MLVHERQRYLKRKKNSAEGYLYGVAKFLFAKKSTDVAREEMKERTFRERGSQVTFLSPAIIIITVVYQHFSAF